METLIVILVILLAVVFSGWLARALPVHLPLPIIQIVLGAAIASFSSQSMVMDPHLFFVLFLPPLLFLEGWRIPKRVLVQDRVMIVQLALGLVIVTVLGVGFFLNALIPAMPLSVAFALAAIVSPTDPVAVSAISSRVPIPKRVMHILEGESLLNDASGLVCFHFAVAATITGVFSLSSASFTFLWMAIGGLTIGAGFTYAASFAQNWLGRYYGEEPGAQILISLLIPIGAYIIAEHYKASGILAAVAAGIAMSRIDMTGNVLAVTRVQRKSVWDMLQFSLNGIIFVLLGEQLPAIFDGAVRVVETTGHHNPLWLIVYALCIYGGLLLIRFCWAWLCMQVNGMLARKRGEEFDHIDLRMTLALSLGGVRGAITMAGIMTLPFLLPSGEEFPARELAIFLASIVIILSLLIASLFLPRLLKDLELPPVPARQAEEEKARQEAASSALEAIENTSRLLGPTQGNPQMFAEAAARAMDAYRQRVAHNTLPDDEAELLREQAEMEEYFRLIGLRAERDAIYRLARSNQLSDEASRSLVHEIDMVEARLH